MWDYMYTRFLNLLNLDFTLLAWVYWFDTQCWNFDMTCIHHIHNKTDSNQVHEYKSDCVILVTNYREAPHSVIWRPMFELRQRGKYQHVMPMLKRHRVQACFSHVKFFTTLYLPISILHVKPFINCSSILLSCITLSAYDFKKSTFYCRPTTRGRLQSWSD